MIGERIIELVVYIFSLLTAKGRKSFGIENEESLTVVRLVRDFRVSHWL